MREIETKAKMKINGLLLPQHLITLVSQGLWKRPSNTDALQKLTGCKSCHEFDFLSFESMKRESNPTHLIDYLLPTSPQRERDEVNYRSNVLLKMGE